MIWKSRLAALRVYLSRVLNWQFNNSPYLSGDTFSDLCDSTYPRAILRVRDRKMPRRYSETVFVSGDRFEEFLSKIEKFPRARVLVVGNSDKDWHSFEYQLPPQITSIFLQNNFVESQNIRSLPIGLENRRLGVNGIPSRFRKVSQLIPGGTRCCDKPLLTYLSPTHESRLALYDQIENFHFISERLSPEKYLRALAQHRFVICPRGNGVDTHRFWESLYFNSFPIVIESEWSKLLKRQLRLPIVEVPDWESVPKVIQNLRENHFFASETPQLWATYWKNSFHEALQS